MEIVWSMFMFTLQSLRLRAQHVNTQGSKRRASNNRAMMHRHSTYKSTARAGLGCTSKNAFTILPIPFSLVVHLSDERLTIRNVHVPGAK